VENPNENRKVPRKWPVKWDANIIEPLENRFGSIFNMWQVKFSMPWGFIRALSLSF